MDEFNALRRAKPWAGVRPSPEVLAQRIESENDRGFTPVFGVACCIPTPDGQMILAPGCFRSLASVVGD